MKAISVSADRVGSGARSSLGHGFARPVLATHPIAELSSSSSAAGFAGTSTPSILFLRWQPLQGRGEQRRDLPHCQVYPANHRRIFQSRQGRCLSRTPARHHSLCLSGPRLPHLPVEPPSTPGGSRDPETFSNALKSHSKEIYDSCKTPREVRRFLQLL